MSLEHYSYLGNTFIKYKNNKLTGYLLLKIKDRVRKIQLDEEELEFIRKYPNVTRKLKTGEELYLRLDNAYLGKREEEDFLSSYDSNNTSLYNLISILDDRIKNNEVNIKKLTL